MSSQLSDNGLLGVGNLPGQCKIERTTKSVDVAASVNFVAVDCLFGSDVVRGTHAMLSINHGQCELVSVGIMVSQAKVQQLDLATVVDEQIAGLDVTVDQASFVSLL